MAKFYLQSGISEAIVTAADAEGAALWFLNRVINRNLPSNFNANEQQMSEAQLCLVIATLDEMDPEINVSQMGLERNEAGCFDTEIIFKQWCSLINAMNALFDQLSD